MYSIYLPVIQSMNMTTKYSDLTQLNPYLHEPFSRKSLVDALDLGAKKRKVFLFTLRKDITTSNR